jgi:hypothetical protein
MMPSPNVDHIAGAARQLTPYAASAALFEADVRHGGYHGQVTVGQDLTRIAVGLGHATPAASGSARTKRQSRQAGRAPAELRRDRQANHAHSGSSATDQPPASRKAWL